LIGLAVIGAMACKVRAQMPEQTRFSTHDSTVPVAPGFFWGDYVESWTDVKTPGDAWPLVGLLMTGLASTLGRLTRMGCVAAGLWFGPVIALVGIWSCIGGTSLIAQQPLFATNYVRQWGSFGFDTRSRELPCLRIACFANNTAHLVQSGQLFVQGIDGYGATRVPAPPPGLSYVDMALSVSGGMALLSDGTAVGWGLFWPTGFGLPPVAPLLPPGLRYNRVCMPQHGLLLRSDGVVLAWGTNSAGETNVPPIPPGTSVVDIRAGYGRSGLMLSDGSILLFGLNNYNQNNVPALPSGVTIVDLVVQRDFTLALRSDGIVEAFGLNNYGQCQVPSLPPGVIYTQIAAGIEFGAACRSDDVLVTWGATGTGTGSTANPPLIPNGLQCDELDAGQGHVVARLSNGSLLSWGYNNFLAHFIPYREPLGTPMVTRYVDVSPSGGFTMMLHSDGTVVDFGVTNGTVSFPPLPAGERYVKVRGGTGFAVAMRSDGEVLSWGVGPAGQTNIPPLPNGTRYVDLAVSNGHTVLLRSDGEVLAFGTNNVGETNVPPLPAGMTYTQIEAVPLKTVLLRSDSTLHYFGVSSSMQNVPSPPPGRTFVDIVTAQHYAVAICSDGTAITWGSSNAPSVPAPPPGVAYLDGAGQESNVVLRRSDGQAVVLGSQQPSLVPAAPPLDPGTSYVQVAAASFSLAGRVGPTSTYVSVAWGCSGSLPVTRLVPRDTPRIDASLLVRLIDLPVNIAMIAMAFQPFAQPVNLATIGMPGCTWHVPLDGVALLFGQANEAEFVLAIPNVKALVGTRFYHQALVLDPQAGNAFGAVVSDVAEGVVGHW